MQCDLFSAASLARTIEVPRAPQLEISRHKEWPYPGSTPTECAQTSLAMSDAYADMLAAVIKTQGGNQLSSDGVMALIPDDWRKALGKYLHATMVEWQCKPRGIDLRNLMRPDGTLVFMYQAAQHEAMRC